MHQARDLEQAACAAGDARTCRSGLLACSRPAGLQQASYVAACHRRLFPVKVRREFGGLLAYATLCPPNGIFRLPGCRTLCPAPMALRGPARADAGRGP